MMQQGWLRYLSLVAAAVTVLVIPPVRAEPEQSPVAVKPAKPERTQFRLGKLPAGFVRLADIAPGIIEDMRYATVRNFTGRRVPGYQAGRCILARPVATALAGVQAAVSSDGFRLKVYDCYRPARAVRAFVRWADGRSRRDATKFYYPRISRDRIIALGYVAEHSSHSRGTAIDLTLVRREREPGAVNSKDANRPTGSCIAPKAERMPDNSIDMGTSWDCFDVKSHTHHEAIPADAKANRRRLLRAMQAAGFRNYAREWWHFSLPVKSFYRAHDFPVD